jgi:hypothetical protein
MQTKVTTSSFFAMTLVKTKFLRKRKENYAIVHEPNSMGGSSFSKWIKMVQSRVSFHLENVG